AIAFSPTSTSRVTDARDTARRSTASSGATLSVLTRRASQPVQAREQLVVNQAVRCDLLQVIVLRIATIEARHAAAGRANERHRRGVRDDVGLERDEAVESTVGDQAQLQPARYDDPHAARPVAKAADRLGR